MKRKGWNRRKWTNPLLWREPSLCWEMDVSAGRGSVGWGTPCSAAAGTALAGPAQDVHRGDQSASQILGPWDEPSLSLQGTMFWFGVCNALSAVDQGWKSESDWIGVGRVSSYHGARSRVKNPGVMSRPAEAQATHCLSLSLDFLGCILEIMLTLAILWMD